MKKIHAITVFTITSSLICSTFAFAANTATTPEVTTEAPAQAQPQSWLKGNYVNKEKKYSINYPAQWQKKDVPRLDIALFPPPKGAALQPHASMNIVSEVVGPAISLDQFYSESVKNINNELKDVHVDAKGDITLNGIPAKKIQYTHIMGGVNFTVLQYFIVGQETIYLLTFSALSDDFDSYKNDFENVASSFRFLPKQNEAPAAK